MPQSKRVPDRTNGAARRRAGGGETTDLNRLKVVRTYRAITMGAVGLVLVGSLALWLMWPREVPLPAQPTAVTTLDADSASTALAPEPSPEPVTPMTRTLVRGIALGGDAVTIDGQRWLGHHLALANGLILGAGTTVASRAAIIAPRLEFDTKSMLEGGLVSSGPVKLSQRLPNGEYEVVLWVAGAQGVNPALLVLRLCGADVATGAAAGAPTWSRLGPFHISVRQRLLDIVVAGLGDAHLAGLAITTLGRGESTVPPVVSLTHPGADAQLSSGDINLIADVVPADGGLAAVEFYDGSTRLGMATSTPYTLVWHKPAVGRRLLSSVAIDTMGVNSRSGLVAVTIKEDDGSRELAIERAREGLRALGLESSLLVQDNDGWRLDLAENQAISDVSWLKGVPVTRLDVGGTKVRDLSVLAGMPLRWLSINGTGLHDVRQLKDLPLTELHAMNCGISDLAPLAGLKLKVLDVGKNPVTTLAPLAGMELYNLSVQGDPIGDLRPLAGMPIEDLDLSGTKVRDLTQLAGLPIKRLSIKDCPVTTLAPLTGLQLRALDVTRVKVDLTPLRGMQLESLCIDDANVRDLGPLAGMPLKRLEMWGCQATSLAPLVGMPLEALLMSNSTLTDLTPIAGLPLVHLDLRACERLRSLAPVAKLTKLRYLYLPKARPDLDALRSLVDVQVREDGNDQPRAIGDFIEEWKAARERK